MFTRRPFSPHIGGWPLRSLPPSEADPTSYPISGLVGFRIGPYVVHHGEVGFNVEDVTVCPQLQMVVREENKRR